MDAKANSSDTDQSGWTRIKGDTASALIRVNPCRMLFAPAWSRPLCMTDSLVQHDFTLEPDDTQRLANLCGPFDEHLRQIELRLGVEISNRGNVFRVIGEDDAVKSGERVLRSLYAATEHETLNGRVLNVRLSEAGVDALADKQAEGAQEVVIKVKRGTIRGRGPNQIRYLHAIATHDINFGIGP